jgi:hypothetical protein
MAEEDIIFADIDGISDEMKFLRETKDKIVSEFVNFHFISSEKFRWYVKYNSDDYFIVVLDGLEDKDKKQVESNIAEVKAKMLEYTTKNE